MSIRIYMDVHVRRAVSLGLRRRGVDVLTAQEDGAAQLSDSDLIDRATALGRAIFSQDYDMLQEAARRMAESMDFAGVIYAHQLRITIGQTIRDLELMARVFEPADLSNRVEYLPL